MANLDTALLNKFRLGYVHDPLPGHERFTGMLAIPYLRWHPRHGWSCIQIRFRALDGSKPKYLSESGDSPHLFNTVALCGDHPVVGIAEGEIDAITATLCGLPTVAVPGASIWQPFWHHLFEGFEQVVVMADGDEAGGRLAETICGALENAQAVTLPENHDINSLLTSFGKEAVTDLWKAYV